MSIFLFVCLYSTRFFEPTSLLESLEYLRCDFNPLLHDPVSNDPVYSSKCDEENHAAQIWRIIWAHVGIWIWQIGRVILKYRSKGHLISEQICEDIDFPKCAI